MVVPGETQVNGKNAAPFGKTGSALSETAGTAFGVSVIGVDNYWNMTSTYVPTIGCTTTDPYATALGQQPLVNGTTVFYITFVSANDSANWNTYWTITATASTAMSAYTSANISVMPAATSRMQVLVSSEIARPGKPPYINNLGGMDNSPVSQTAGTGFQCYGERLRLLLEQGASRGLHRGCYNERSERRGAVIA